MTIQSAMVAAVSQPKLVYRLNQSQDELWMCDVKIARGEDAVLFRQVIFVETGGMAYVYGIEYENGFPIKLSPPERALIQQEFILFLRSQSQQDLADLAAANKPITSGHQFWAEAKVTAAYAAARGVNLGMGIGFYAGDEEGYQLVTIDPVSSGWADTAKLMPRFDQISVLSGPTLRS